MPFESGIPRYVKAKATITVFFPVDDRGTEYIKCEMCRFYSSNTRRCRLTDEVIAFPTKYVGGYCPLKESEDET